MADVLGGILGGGGITGGLGDIFGSSSEKTATGTTTEKGTATSFLELDEEAITKIITDVLGSSQGLASIFAGEQASGLYSSSVAAKEAGDLTTQLIGELAKLTGKQVETVDRTTTSSEKSGESSGGLLGQAKGLLGGLF